MEVGCCCKTVSRSQSILFFNSAGLTPNLHLKVNICEYLGEGLTGVSPDSSFLIVPLWIQMDCSFMYILYMPLVPSVCFNTEGSSLPAVPQQKRKWLCAGIPWRYDVCLILDCSVYVSAFVGPIHSLWWTFFAHFCLSDSGIRFIFQEADSPRLFWSPSQ